MGEHICFTVLTSDTPSGFTDQLFQFNTFYKLGLSLGYKYLHTEFESPRSAPGIYDFLGFNEYFRDANLLCDTSRFDRVFLIDLDDDLIRVAGIQSFESLKNHVVSRVGQASSSNHKLVQFRLAGKRGFFDLINNHIARLQDGLSLRDIYLDARIKDPCRPVFAPGKIRVLVHIRQGDTAIIATPWGTHIPVTRHIYPELREFNSLEDIGHASNSVGVNDFYRATSTLLSLFGEDSLSVIVSSDGFSRAFERIFREGEECGISAEQLSSLRQVEQEYQALYLKFNSLVDVECIVGETEDNLYRFIHASLFADIIVIGTQQRMMQKLLLSFHNPANHPVIIMLNNRSVPEHSRQVSFHTGYSTIIPASLKDKHIYISAFQEVVRLINMKHETSNG